MQYLIKRGLTTIATVTPTGQQSKKIMGENIVTMNVELSSVGDFRINDYVDVFVDDIIERYFLLDLADVKKSSSRDFDYTITFKGWQYLLDKAAYKFPDSTNEYTLSGQGLMGNLDTFIDLLVINANREQTGWVKGTVDTTDFQLITFNDNDTCLSVLATLSTAFNGIEFWVDGQTIHMTKRGVVESVTYKYGKGNGLYDITRTTSTNKKLVTRLYVYGSDKNLPSDYKGYSDKLKLPGSTPYIEKNVWVNPVDHSQGLLYGVNEDTQVFSNIYPHRTGLVTTVTDEFNFIDSSIDFDVNLQLLPGITAHIVFNTGQLAGNTFDLGTFNNTTKSFKINQLKDDKGYVLPTTTIKPAVGDEYVIVDIEMPSSYITTAENELLAAAQSYLNENCDPIVTYAVTCDPINFKQRGLHLTLGNFVHLIDSDLGLDDNIRITGFTRDLQQPYRYTMELADTTSLAPNVAAAVSSENLTKTVSRIGKTANSSYNNALQAKATAEGVKLITDYWGVTIDPAHGIVASGTLLVGAGPVGNAGITGVIDNVISGVDNSVRVFAGADYAHKDTAPFRVLDTGKMYATNAEISGKITATSGKIGNWDIQNYGLSNTTATGDAYMILQRTFTDGDIDLVVLGIQTGTLYSSLLTLSNIEAKGVQNVAAEFEARNGTTPSGADPDFANIGLRSHGTTELQGPIWTILSDGTPVKGITQNVEYSRGGDNWTAKFVNGIYTGNVNAWGI